MRQLQHSNIVQYLGTERTDDELEAMLGALGPDKLIANLGEGLMGKEDQGLVNAFVDDVHATSRKLIAERNAVASR